MCHKWPINCRMHARWHMTTQTYVTGRIYVTAFATTVNCYDLTLVIKILPHVCHANIMLQKHYRNTLLSPPPIHYTVPDCLGTLCLFSLSKQGGNNRGQRIPAWRSDCSIFVCRIYSRISATVCHTYIGRTQGRQLLTHGQMFWELVETDGSNYIALF